MNLALLQWQLYPPSEHSFDLPWRPEDPPFFLFEFFQKDICTAFGSVTWFCVPFTESKNTAYSDICMQFMVWGWFLFFLTVLFLNCFVSGKTQYSWIGHRLQSGPTLAFSLWLSALISKRRPVLGFSSKKSWVVFIFSKSRKMSSYSRKWCFW